MSRSYELNLINFIANRLYLADEPDEIHVLWLCLDYKLRAGYIREAQRQFEIWVLNETIAREKRRGNIRTIENEE